MVLFSETGSHYVTRTDLELTMPLPQLSKYMLEPYLYATYHTHNDTVFFKLFSLASSSVEPRRMNGVACLLHASYVLGTLHSSLHTPLASVHVSAHTMKDLHRGPVT